MALLRWFRWHLGLVGEIAGYGVWLLLDLVYFLSGGPSVNLVAGVVITVIVSARRRPGVPLVPVAIAAITVSLGFSSAGLGPPPFASDMSYAEQLALAVVVIAVLHRCPLRPALLLAGATAVAIVCSPIARTQPELGAIFALLSALGWGGAVGIGMVQWEAESVRRASLEEVRSTERMELARELHDVVAHHVTGIIVAAQAAAVVARRSPDDVDRALAAIENAGADAMSAMRSMVGVCSVGTPTAPVPRERSSAASTRW